jgi:hypothetical protein
MKKPDAGCVPLQIVVAAVRPSFEALKKEILF